MTDSVTIAPARSDDSARLRDLADLDSRRPLHGPALLAFVGGELRAALSVNDGRVVADPFRPSDEVVELLRHAARAGHISRAA